jgi:hypothetical protein
MCSAQRQGERGSDGIPKFDIFTGIELRSRFGDSPPYLGWKKKDKAK